MATISSLRAPQSQVFSGYFTTNTSTGTASVTGVGFQPEWITVVGVHTNTASELIHVTGTYDGTTHDSDGKTVYDNTGSVGIYNTDGGGGIVQAYNSAGSQVRIDISSLDSDGFTYLKDVAAFALDVYYICGRG